MIKTSLKMLLFALCVLFLGCSGSSSPFNTVEASSGAKEDIVAGTRYLHPGYNLIKSITVNGINYHLVAHINVDMDPNFRSYALQIIKGDWQAARAEVIAEPKGFVSAASDYGRSDPAIHLAAAVAEMNNAIAKYNSQMSEPTTWDEKFELALQKVSLVVSGESVALR